MEGKFLLYNKHYNCCYLKLDEDYIQIQTKKNDA